MIDATHPRVGMGHLHQHDGPTFAANLVHLRPSRYGRDLDHFRPRHVQRSTN